MIFGICYELKVSLIHPNLKNECSYGPDECHWKVYFATLKNQKKKFGFHEEWYVKLFFCNVKICGEKGCLVASKDWRPEIGLQNSINEKTGSCATRFTCFNNR